MKRFPTVLDASLQDDQGEQSRLVAFPHCVLQPGHDYHLHEKDENVRESKDHDVLNLLLIALMAWLGPSS